MQLPGRVRIVKEGNCFYKHKFPLVCYYQRCEEPIIKMPFVSKGGEGRQRAKYYHVDCATILRVV